MATARGWEDVRGPGSCRRCSATTARLVSDVAQADDRMVRLHAPAPFAQQVAVHRLDVFERPAEVLHRGRVAQVQVAPDPGLLRWRPDDRRRPPVGAPAAEYHIFGRVRGGPFLTHHVVAPHRGQCGEVRLAARVRGPNRPSRSPGVEPRRLHACRTPTSSIPRVSRPSPAPFVLGHAADVLPTRLIHPPRTADERPPQPGATPYRSTIPTWPCSPDRKSAPFGEDVPSRPSLRIPVKPITRSGGKPITCSGANRSPVPTQTDHLSERSDAGRNHESRFSVRVDGRLRFRIESPFRSSLYALCTRRSRIALASVGSPMTSCHLRLPPISRTG